MEQQHIKLTKLIANEGMTLTNGETFCKVVYLSCNGSPEDWREIPDEEAEALQNEELEGGE